MSVAIRTATRVQDQDDVNVTVGAGVDEYALCWDNDTAKFVLRATTGHDHGLLAGLSDDDHPQYLAKSGGTMTGALDFNYQGARNLYSKMLVVNAAGGADYTTITAAIAAATTLTPGAGNLIAIMVYPGTYTETWTLPEYVSLVAPAGGVLCTSSAISGPIFTFAGSQNVVNIRFQAAQNSTYRLCLVTGGAITFSNCQMYGYAVGNSTICYTLRFEAVSGDLYLYNCVVDMINYGTPAVTRASALSVLGYPSSQDVIAHNTTFRASRVVGTGTYIALHSEVDLNSTYYGCTISGTTYSVFCGNTLSLIGGSIYGATRVPVVFADTAAHLGVSNLASTVTTMNAAAATDKLLILKGAASQSANLQEWQNSNADVLALIGPNGTATFQPLDAATNAVTNVVTIGHNTSGTAAAGLGAGLLYQLESSTTAAQDAARIQALWYEATHATRKADLVLTAYDTAEREGLRIRGAGSAPAIGFYGVTPIERATLATGAGASVDDVITALQNLGLVKQS